MQRLLLFFTLFLAAVVAKAGNFTWQSNDGEYTVTASESGNAQNPPEIQVLEVSGPGALAAFVNATKGNTGQPPGLENEPLYGLGKGPRVNISIKGELNADDFDALDSDEATQWSHYTAVNLSEAIFDLSDITGMNMGGMEYLRLPNGMTSADGLVEMGKLQQGGKNANLKVVASCDNSNASIPEMAVYSFSENNLPTAKSTFAGMPWETAKKVRMAGSFGDHDLVDGDRPIWGYSGGAVWDFTDANFANVTLNASSYVVDGPYYHYDDPFELGSTYTEGANYSTNAFIYFMNYAKAAVDVKLPESLTALPVGSMQYLGVENKENYKLVYGLTEEQFQNKFGASAEYGTIEELVIPDAVENMDMSCLNRACIRKISIGSGIAYIKAGACAYCPNLEEVEFRSGLDHDCYVGDQAFIQCDNIKHITLTEGIVSLGAHCFERSRQVESISLPSTLEYIGNKCFYQCYALSSITIPRNVKQIGQSAFLQAPLSDIYLMAETPEEVPVIFTAGSAYGDAGADGHATFYSGTLENWNTIPWDGNTSFAGSTLNQMTWDDAATAFFNSNGMAMLHYNPGVADVVMESISDLYQATSTDGVKLPTMSGGARDLRGTANGEHDMGAAREGTWSKYGWAQFMLLKRFTYEVYEREYDDVWNTICFPFDLTDEQLDVAFNRGFNIVDFSGVEIQEKTETNPLTLILHFNSVAKTIYKDTENTKYTEIRRETHQQSDASSYEYNVYQDEQGNEYHHVITSPKLVDNKTKTFCRGSSLSDAQSNFNNKTYPAVEIDGYLASAGHPYMVHPNTGTNSGMPLKRCQFSGITWDHDRDYSKLFEDEARSVDLGVAMGNQTTGKPDDNNFYQAAYSRFAGQTYTFIGNPTAFKEGAPAEPTDQYQSYPPYPTLESYPPEPSLERGDEPQPPTDPTSTVGARKTEADAPTRVDNPADDTETYPTAFQTLFNTVRCTGLDYSTNPATEVNYTYGNDLVAGNFGEFFWGEVGNPGYPLRYADRADLHSHISCDYTALENYLGSADQTDIQDKFNALKTLASNFANAKPAYDAYLVELQAYQDNIDAWNQYDRDYAQYQADHVAWLNWTAEGAQSAHDAWEQECEEIDGRNAPLISQYNTDCANVDRYNKGIKDAWEASLAAYKRLIPKGAYFLGRKGRGWPKYYREIAEEDRENPKGGFWTQYTAIIIPDAAAIAGIEAELDGTSSQGANQSVEMVFDEGFTGDFVTTDEIEQIISEAEEKGQKVEYMQVVYNINGQIVREGTSLEGLPKGIYIVNGKKYFVK